VNHQRYVQTEDDARPVTSVIGAGGFIGRPLYCALSSGGIPAHAFTRRTPFQRGSQLHPALLESTIIFYLASSITPAVAHREPGRVADDRLAFQVFLNSLRENSHRPLVVLTSSGGTVYDPLAAPPYREDSRTAPDSAYGAAKLAQEQDLIASAAWVSPAILRLANVYGPGQPAKAGYGVIGHWIEAIRTDRMLRMIGPPQSRRDYIHVTDVISAMLLIGRNAQALRSSPGPTILNIGSGVPTSLAELHRCLELAVGRRLDVQNEASRTFDRPDAWLDIQLALRAIGWKPEISLPEGLADAWQRVPGRESSEINKSAVSSGRRNA
jgi:UDP-glucose 4-epimerase